MKSQNKRDKLLNEKFKNHIILLTESNKELKMNLKVFLMVMIELEIF
jgi:hypothetical protein